MKIALITGASSGMGKEFAFQIAAYYQKLDEIWVIARNSRKLEEISLKNPGKFRPLALDLRDKEDRESLKEQLGKADARIKLLVNAAGVGKIGQFEKMSWESQEEMLRLNMEALTAVTYLCLPYMRRGSRIIQMASAAAFLPQPGFAVYAASKSYVLSFSQALRFELRERGISVTAVCPGPVDTPFFDKAEEAVPMPAYKKKFMAKPKDVVKKAVRDCAIGREVSVYGGSMKALQIVSKLLPACLTVWASQYLDHLDEDAERK